MQAAKKHIRDISKNAIFPEKQQEVSILPEAGI
jgi:cbb3-type cytochrome oxidase subunit 3